MRLDNVIFHLGLASTVPAARQLVNHRHILVNNNVLDIPSYRCKPKDIITVRNRPTSYNALSGQLTGGDKTPDHLTISLSEDNKPTGLVKCIANRESVNLNINELLVVEYYSRKA